MSDQEKQAVLLFSDFVKDNADTLRVIAHWGDGYGGYLRDLMMEQLGIAPPTAIGGSAKDKISRRLAKRVFERDGYRCTRCGGWIDLTCDHVHPESLGGLTVFENLQTMCRPCNSRKGVQL